MGTRTVETTPGGGHTEAVNAYIGYAIAAAIGLIVLFHPGFSEPGLAQVVVPSVAAAFAAVLALAYAMSGYGLRRAAAMQPARVPVNDTGRFEVPPQTSMPSREELVAEVVADLSDTLNRRESNGRNVSLR